MMVQKIFKTAAVRRALLLGSGLHLLQQFIGVNAVQYYNSSVIQMSGVRSDVITLWLSSAVLSCSAVGHIISFCLVDKIGRRKLILISLMGILIGLVFIITSLFLISKRSPSVSFEEPYAGMCSVHGSCNKCILDEWCGFCYSEANDMFVVNNTGSCLPVDKVDAKYALTGRCSKSSSHSQNNSTPYTWAVNFCPSNYSYVALVGMMIYLLSFGLGMGPVVWLVNAEIYPPWASSFCNGAATTANWTANLIVSMTFLSLTKAITRHGTFLLYFSMAIFGFALVLIFLPETKDKPLEEVTHLFNQPMWNYSRRRCSRKPDVSYSTFND
ncbi:proton myo-inositol cotransporter-like [Amphiura filiformis]|uniref:proton myo-inositol cotransporter-like n=1 Tax=Amphiura filiformis TaxID=82378 RepID=UPI003B21178E